MVFVRGVGERRSGSTMNALKGEIAARQFTDLDVRVSHLPESPNSSISFNYFIMLTNVLLIRRVTRTSPASRNPRRPSRDKQPAVCYHQLFLSLIAQGKKIISDVW